MESLYNKNRTLISYSGARGKAQNKQLVPLSEPLVDYRSRDYSAAVSDVTRWELAGKGAPVADWQQKALIYPPIIETMKKEYKVPVDLKDEEIEYRDHIIEELKARTGSNMVNIIAYRENQMIEPYTTNSTQICLELRVGNQISKLIISPEQDMLQGRAVYYGMRELVNKMMARLIKAGANAM